MPPNLPHLTITGTAAREQYVYAGGAPRTRFRKPPRDDRLHHASVLKSQLEHAQADADELTPPEDRERRRGITLEFTGEPGFDLAIDSLANRQQGIELANVRQGGDRVRGTVFIPEGKVEFFFNRIDQYANQDTEAGRPRHERLIESISEIRLAAVEAFWTDDPSLFPPPDQQIWWEVWLRSGATEEAQDTAFAEFVAEAVAADFQVGEQAVRFPERIVLLVRGTQRRWAGSINLLNRLAELRRTKEVPTEYVALAPSEQAEFIADVVTRIQPPANDAPAVCLLDTGVNRNHPLLAVALADEHTLSVNPNWLPADHDGHGTEMAGLALYGCLTQLFVNDGSVQLHHRLESVKILPPQGNNDPEHYGAITQEAVARAEVASPARSRVGCLTVTSDDRDGGLPTSWSAAIDQMCAGALDDQRRLIIAAAGNLPTGPSSNYPDCNRQEYGIQDPAQSWNALSVGGYTERVHIATPELSGWQPLAPHGSLSPTSTTSQPWRWSDAPLKPDIVMEAGNCAVPPGGGAPDFVNDLALLTTCVHPSGRLLTTTGETSAAAAQAARLAAHVQAQYPNYWPETIRGLLVHAARWTPRMLAEFPPADRQARLRAYGNGVPDPVQARWSAGNAATLVVQEAFRPYMREQGEIKYREMDFHHLPWPTEVLRELGPIEVTMRVTLSYFIEPSPGRCGWKRRHRYQSHGLRFDVKRPTESAEGFRQRLTRAAWDDPETRPQNSGDSHDWQLGARSLARSYGSVHSDFWTGTAADLADSGLVGVYPVTGWWRERPHLERWGRLARYALILSIKTEEVGVDLYTEIQNQVAVSQQIEIA